MISRILTGLGAFMVLAVGLAAGYWWAERNSTMTTAVAPSGSKTERQALYWYDPMVPDKHFDKPGKSPFMDMQLVPKYADQSVAGGVRIDSGLQQNVGIRTAEVQIGRLSSALLVPGTLAWDLREERLVAARVEASVLNLRVKAPFTRVHRGEPLVTLRAPGWSSALAEALALREARSDSARELQAAAEQRLRVLGVPKGAQAVEGTVTLSSPIEGVVTEVMVREGETVTPGAALFRINGTSSIWLEASLPQREAGLLRPGANVSVVVSGLPGQTFPGRVESLLPQVDAATRTQRARIVLPNPQGRLASGMFAEVSLETVAPTAVPLIPTDSLISTGEASRVIVRGPDGSFHPVVVRTGRSSGGRTEVLEGLSGGEQVVVSGQFLIDSEASLSGAMERLQ